MSIIRVTENINVLVQSALKTAISNNDPATLKELIAFSEEILYKCIKNGASDQFKEYIDIPVLLNLIIADRVKEKETVSTDINKYSFKIPARILRENLGMHLGDLGKDVTEPLNRDVTRVFYYETYRNFNVLLFKAISEKDLEAFQLILTQFTKGFERTNYHKHLQVQKRNHSESQSPEQEYGVDTPLNNEENGLLKEVGNIRRLIITGARYWLNFIFYKTEIDEKLFEEFTRLLRIPISSGNDIINDLLFVTKSNNEKYLDWIKWEYDVNADGEKQKSRETTSSWMAIGFLIDIIRNGSFYMNPDKLSESEVSEALKVYRSLKEIKEDIIIQGHKWVGVLGTSSNDGLRDLIKRVLSPFKLLEGSLYKTLEEQIAAMELSESRISEFKRRATELWRKQARMRSLFERMDSQRIISIDDKNLIRVGQRNFLEKGKIAFIEDEDGYSRIYGLEEMGGIIGRWEDDLFFEKFNEVEYRSITGNTSEQALDAAILELKKGDVIPSIIITSPEFSYKDENLLNSEKFKPKANLIIDSEEIAFFYIGSYDEIPIFTSFNAFVQNRFVVCDFKKSFEMEYKSRQDWQQGLLNIAVRDLTSVEIAERIIQYNNKLNKANDQPATSVNEIRNTIAASVVIDAWSILDFIIKDNSTFVVVEIE